MLTILIACDHKAYRESLTRLLAAHSLFHITAVCADTHAAITMTANAAPDIVFIDGSTDQLAAIEATKKIRSVSNAGIIALSRQSDASFAAHMLAAGALGYLTSRSSDIEIITAIEEVAKDNLYYCLDTKFLPVATPKPASSFKKTINLLRTNTRERINRGVETHWHGILKFTN